MTASVAAPDLARNVRRDTFVASPPASDHALDPEAGAGRGGMNSGAVSPLSDLPLDSWEPDEPLAWYRQWSRGWRLGVVLLVLTTGYAVWRGRSDYAAVKAWRGRHLAAKSIKAAAGGSTEEAARLLDQAGALGPADPTVLRALADFNEPRGDPMALYALAQMLRVGVATDSDVQRLCRLALDWGRPELAPAAVLQQWATVPAEGLLIEKLELGARWLAIRGRTGEAEQRLRLALDSAAKTPADQVRVNLTLAGLLASRASGAPAPERVLEAGTRLMAVAKSSDASAAQHRQALEGLVDVVLSPGAQTVFSQDAVTALQAELTRHLAAAPAESRTSLRLAEVRLMMALDPQQRGALASTLANEAATAPMADSLRICRWLNQNGFPESALHLHDSVAPPADDRDWFIARLDALFGMHDWAELNRILKMEDQPLPPLMQALFLYRADRSAGKPEEDLSHRKEEIVVAARSAQARDVLYAAGNLELAGDLELAIPLFRSLQRNDQFGLSARLGLVRCLHRFPNETPELVRTLEELVTLWPQSHEARNDLAYLRLLEGAPRPEEVTLVKELVRESPQLLGYRITAGLAALQQGQPAEALRLIDGATIQWSEVRPDWRIIYACVLAANDQSDEARGLAATVAVEQLRPGERALMARHLPAAP